MLTEGELAGIRRTVAVDALPTLATIQTATKTSDGQGGFTTTWASTTAVPCRMAPATSSQDGRTTADRWQMHTPWVMTLAHDYTVSTGDRVVIGSDTYEVLRVESGRSWQTATRAHLRRID